jgi:hypothetical protein
MFLLITYTIIKGCSHFGIYVNYINQWEEYYLK